MEKVLVVTIRGEAQPEALDAAISVWVKNTPCYPSIAVDKRRIHSGSGEADKLTICNVVDGFRIEVVWPGGSSESLHDITGLSKTGYFVRHLRNRANIENMQVTIREETRVTIPE
jgi:hypothetical protein